MRIIIKSAPVEIYVQTVLISKNEPHKDSTLFRCDRCGTAISRIPGKIDSIIAGEIPTDTIHAIQQCYRCYENYIFVPYQGVPRRFVNPTTLVLPTQPMQETSVFRCFVCRSPLLEYNKDTTIYIPTVTPITNRSMFVCANPECHHEYYLQDVVSI